MIGTIRWNLVLAAIGFVFTFLFSVFHNLFLTTILRSFYCFAVLFLIGFVVRWLLGTLVGLNRISLESGNRIGEDDLKGGTIDLQTPDEAESLNQLLKQNIDNTEKVQSFTPLTPPKLSAKIQQDPQEMAEAIRRLIED